ncbi:MAG: WD40 repeat domain-containing protein [Planctomycetota bacterium]
MCSLGASAVLTLAAFPQDPPSFYRDVLPVLQANCTSCHQPAKSKDDLVLSSYVDVMRGKGHGEDREVVVVPGDPDASPLIESVIGHGGEPPAMPEKGDPLSAGNVDILRRWVADGAVDDTPPGATQPVRPDRPPQYRLAPVVTSLAWSPDGDWLAVNGRSEVLLHSMRDETRPPRRLVGLAERIESIAFSPDGSRLGVVGGSPGRFGEVQVWSLASDTLEVSRVVTPDCVFGVSWSPDGRLVAFGGTDTVVRAIDASSGEQVLFQGAHDDWVLDTVFSRDGSHLVTVSRDRSMKLTKVESQQFIDNITSITPGALKGGLISVAGHPERDELLVGGADGTPRLYRTFREKKRVIGDDFNLIRAFESMPGRVFAVAFVDHGAKIASVSSHVDGGEARVYSAGEVAPLWRHESPTGLYALAVSPDGAKVAIAGFRGTVEVLDAATGAPERSFVAVPLTVDSEAGGAR